MVVAETKAGDDISLRDSVHHRVVDSVGFAPEDVVLVRPGGFMRSCTHPNKIIPTFAPATAMTAVMSVTPENIPMSITIRVALKLYSTQRKRLMPCRRSDREF